MLTDTPPTPSSPRPDAVAVKVVEDHAGHAADAAVPEENLGTQLPAIGSICRLGDTLVQPGKSVSITV